ncbi:hypothetical protein [Simplicispira suum]|uniref:hypothetical protein n=1 Tax=Simplicispira suum TaxID=2109915 RepID=UPI0011B2306A|nr:hypothetical protein [Simplicispira suum]
MKNPGFAVVKTSAHANARNSYASEKDSHSALIWVLRHCAQSKFFARSIFSDAAYRLTLRAAECIRSGDDLEIGALRFSNRPQKTALGARFFVGDLARRTQSWRLRAQASSVITRASLWAKAHNSRSSRARRRSARQADNMAARPGSGLADTAGTVNERMKEEWVSVVMANPENEGTLWCDGCILGFTRLLFNFMFVMTVIHNTNN